MKKIMKKCFAILLAVAMTLTMAVTAFADEAESTPTYTLKVKNQNAYDTAVEYAVYQLFLCDLDANKVPSYKIDGAVNGSLVTGKTVEDISKMQDESDELYAFAAGISTSDATVYSRLKTNESINVVAGYYLLVPTSLAGTKDSDSDTMHDKGGTVSAPILVAVPGVTKNDDGTYAVTANVEVTAKNSEVSHEKKITAVDSVNGTSDTISNTKDTATAGEDDTIKYTITNTVPKYKADVDSTKVNYFVTDDYDEKLTLKKVELEGFEGLTLGDGVEEVDFIAKNGTTRKVKRVQNGDYFVKKDVDRQFIVYFNFEKIQNATEVKINAYFTLNDDAAPKKDIVNHSKLTYTNNYYGTNSDSELEDEVKSYTFKFNVYKYDTSKTQNAALSGATFGLYKEDGTTLISEVTSGADGIVDFGKLLNAGTYYVKETKAPNGYRVDDKVYKVEIVAGTNDNGEYDGSYTVKVDGKAIGYVVKNGETEIYTATDNIPVLGIGNTPGLSLPGTGGIGTTLFTFGGLALVLVAGVMFIVYTRKQKKQS